MTHEEVRPDFVSLDDPKMEYWRLVLDANTLLQKLILVSFV